MQTQQREFLKKNWVDAAKEWPDLLKLRTKLLSIGGEEMVPGFEEDLDKLINRGIPVINPIVLFRPGRPISCHSNSATYWDERKTTCELMTGWGLSKDGLWRQHSWVRIIKSGHVVETTVPRDSYFGFVMTQKEAAQFVEDNW